MERERGHAVVFGAGNMACGLLGPLLAQSGFAPLFVARRPEVLDAINGRHGYTLQIAGAPAQRLAIRDCAALSVREERRVAAAVADAAVVFTAVGLENLAGITAAIRAGELRVTIEAPGPLAIDTGGLKGPLPPVQGATYTPEFRVLVLRKLFTLNCAHAVAAYLGYRQGCRYLHEAAGHPRVAPVLRGALAEAQAALTAAFPHHAAAIAREAAEALAQTANARLADRVRRVARAPRRKLAPHERLLGPAQ